MTVAALWLLGRAGEAHASCPQPLPHFIWSYPADGDVHVPTNARIFILTADWSPILAIRVNGVAATTTTDGRLGYEAALAPATKYVVELPPSVHHEDEPRVRFQFTTGAGPAVVAKPTPPQFISPRFTNILGLSPFCAAVVSIGHCIDTPRTFLALETAPTEARPLFYALRSAASEATGIWPGICDAPQVFAQDPGTCARQMLRVGAVNLIGEVAFADTPCMPEGATSVIPTTSSTPASAPPTVAATPVASPPTPVSGGCSVDGGRSSPLAGLLVLAGALALVVVRRKK